jgi:hypothetical protein
MEAKVASCMKKLWQIMMVIHKKELPQQDILIKINLETLLL